MWYAGATQPPPMLSPRKTISAGCSLRGSCHHDPYFYAEHPSRGRHQRCRYEQHHACHIPAEPCYNVCLLLSLCLVPLPSIASLCPWLKDFDLFSSLELRTATHTKTTTRPQRKTPAKPSTPRPSPPPCATSSSSSLSTADS